jgi:uncharacterized protein YjbI with pentapeptide repeats
VPKRCYWGKLLDGVDAMKNTRKDEVVWLYELGERNFKRQNLRGKCFRGENLSGADFSGCDIRGADFTNAILEDTQFINVTGGLQKRQATILLGVLFAFAILLGSVAGLIGAFAEVRFFAFHQTDQINFAWITPIVISGFTFVALNRSMAVGFGIFGLAFLVATLAALVSSTAVPIAGNVAVLIAVNALVTSATAAMSALMVAAVLAFRITIALFLALSFIGAFALVIILTETFAPSSSITSAITVASIVLPLAGYIGWQTLKGDRKHTVTWLIANFLSTKWGTSFRGADLTNADFSRAVLQSTDFSKANVTYTIWDRCVWTGNSLS